ncbi:MAG TPA: glycerol-3-phosphate 1-O-acyltransferase PlsY [Candidatus Sulfotelmatobacter sp.]|nr:glycerol-3-phosphate 1-O-acyltransferase PlsY [Candidatus Sulfotelmatobacter sp.]
MPIIGYILTALGAYLLGSIPTGFLVAKARGLDIRAVGSGNIGATNVFRILGTAPGIFVLLTDALKGWLAVAVLAGLVGDWMQVAANSPLREWLRILAGVCAILGHNYTCWLRFKGGKGIATSAGVLIALVPWALLISLGVFCLVLGLSRYVSLASIAAALVLPFATRATRYSMTLVVVTAALGTLAIYKHKANIQRLLKGTENRIGRKRPASTPSAPKPKS